MLRRSLRWFGLDFIAGQACHREAAYGEAFIRVLAEHYVEAHVPGSRWRVWSSDCDRVFVRPPLLYVGPCSAEDGRWDGMSAAIPAPR